MACGQSRAAEGGVPYGRRRGTCCEWQAQQLLPQNPLTRSAHTHTAPQHLVDVWRDGLAPHAHARAVDVVAVFPEVQPPHHHALLGRHDCAIGRGGGQRQGGRGTHGGSARCCDMHACTPQQRGCVAKVLHQACRPACGHVRSGPGPAAQDADRAARCRDTAVRVGCAAAYKALLLAAAPATPLPPPFAPPYPPLPLLATRPGPPSVRDMPLHALPRHLFSPRPPLPPLQSPPPLHRAGLIVCSQACRTGRRAPSQTGPGPVVGWVVG